MHDSDIAVAGALLRAAGDRPDGGWHLGLAIALTVRALRSGSVCIDLLSDPTNWPGPELDSAEDPEAARQREELRWPQPLAWLALLRADPLVAQGESGSSLLPLRLVGSLLYLQRYYLDQRVIAEQVARRTGTRTIAPDCLNGAIDEVFGPPEADAAQPRAAAAQSLRRGLTILAGGPGTGKTTAVARLLAVARLVEPGCRIALAAPTGKAAARLGESLRESSELLSSSARAALDSPSVPPPTTIHRLLGSMPGSRNRFRHDARQPLAADLVVVDECSMVSLPLMARLLEAVPDHARVILVGDPDQLASVEAGAVLADLVATLGPANVVQLDRTWRFSGAIAELAQAIRRGDHKAILTILASGDPSVSLHIPAPGADVRSAADSSGTVADVVRAADEVSRAAIAGDDQAALRALDGHRLLCAHRSGPSGAQAWSDLAAAWVGAPADGSWYAGQPLMITANDYAVDLFNGDSGVIVARSDGLRASFQRGSGFVSVAPSRLSEVTTLHAMTIHRAQGSQFDAVTVVLPDSSSPIMTRELLYTAVTRARSRVRILGTPEAITAAVGRRVARASGLQPTPRPSPGSGTGPVSVPGFSQDNHE